MDHEWFHSLKIALPSPDFSYSNRNWTEILVLCNLWTFKKWYDAILLNKSHQTNLFNNNCCFPSKLRFNYQQILFTWNLLCCSWIGCRWCWWRRPWGSRLKGCWKCWTRGCTSGLKSSTYRRWAGIIFAIRNRYLFVNRTS